MFRTARGFLLVAPPAFVLALASFLISHSHAAEAFVPYPFLADAMGQVLVKRPVARFTIAATFFFLLPYLVSGLLLLFADLGVSAASPLWSKRKRRRAEPLPPESRVAFGIVLVVVSMAAGVSLHKVAHGGELPGGVNVAPVFVAAVPFVSVILATIVAGIVGIPRAILASRATSREASA
jgi:hypothetical protein